MAGQAKRATELKQIAELVADAARGLAYRAKRCLCAVEFNSFGHVCSRAKGHSGPHYAEVRAQAVRS